MDLAELPVLRQRVVKACSIVLHVLPADQQHVQVAVLLAQVVATTVVVPLRDQDRILLLHVAVHLPVLKAVEVAVLDLADLSEVAADHLLVVCAAAVLEVVVEEIKPNSLI